MQETKKILILATAYLTSTLFVWVVFSYYLLSYHFILYLILLAAYFLVPLLFTVHYSRIHFLSVVKYVKENHPAYYNEHGYDDLLYERKSRSKWKSYMILEFTPPDEKFNQMKKQGYYYSILIAFQIIFSLYFSFYLINNFRYPMP